VVVRSRRRSVDAGDGPGAVNMTLSG
jgi:hypothetical protein